MLPILSELTLPADYVEYKNVSWRLINISEQEKENRPADRPMVLEDLRMFFWSTHDGNGNVTADSDVIVYTVRDNGSGTVTIDGTVPYPSDFYDMATSGYCDGVDSLIQTMFIILSTERYKFPIYSFDYGIELIDLFGKPISFAIAEIPRRVTEALTQDNRVNNCTDFRFKTNKSKLWVQFTVETIYGNVNAEMGVTV